MNILRRKKNKIKGLPLNKITFSVIGFIIIIAISVPLARNVSKQYRVNKEITDLQKEITDLKDKNSNLNNLIDYLQSDQFNEEQARLKLNYKKEGEEVAVIKSGDNQGIIDNSENYINYNFDDFAEKPVKKAINNPSRWLKYFLNI